MPERWTHVTAKTLYGGSFEDRKTSIRALIFGEMVRIAEGRIESYRSDLYHDAAWLTDNVNGPTSFEWVVRESGTHCEHSDYIQKVINLFGDESSLLHFRFDVIEDGSEHWKVVVSQAAPINVPDTVKPIDYYRVKATDVYPSLAKSDYGSDDPDAQTLKDAEEASKILSTLDSDSDGTFTEDDRGNWHPVIPTPVKVNKTTKENGTMDEILSTLRDKVEAAQNTKSEIDEHLSDMESAKESLENGAEELDQYINDVNDLINSLERIPEVNVYVDSIDFSSVSFDSNDV